MIIVTDSAADLTAEQMRELNIHAMPMALTLDGRTYRSGVDLSSAEFYSLLRRTEDFPTTSQPSAGEFAELYRRVAAIDPEIFSIHVAGGLSGTLASAQAGAQLVPEARVTFYDTKTLSCPEGWLVQAAAFALRKGWSMPRILERLDLMQQRTQGVFTLNTLKYLIHGGRISHMKGLLASMLNVKPIIGPDKETGKYMTFGQDVTWKRVINRIPEIIAKVIPGCEQMRVQLLHGENMEGVEMLREAMVKRFTCQFDPVAVIAPVLGAHTGHTIVGLAAGDPQVFEGLF
ncbi:MAG: DegV family protein [Chloroflexota bacterium]